ncbi:MAG TPA: hypothetical protein EYH03_05060 [Chromatiales bacterium]|nr:hypothetical protein [Chromatiales bacterium]
MPIKPLIPPAHVALQRSLPEMRRTAPKAAGAMDRTLLELRREDDTAHANLKTVPLAGEMVGTLFDERA